MAMARGRPEAPRTRARLWAAAPGPCCPPGGAVPPGGGPDGPGLLPGVDGSGDVDPHHWCPETLSTGGVPRSLHERNKNGSEVSLTASSDSQPGDLCSLGLHVVLERDRLASSGTPD